MCPVLHWQTTRFEIPLDQPVVMGIVNVTPDSFSGSALNMDTRSALLQCERLVREGAGILDIGGESSRPGAKPVPQVQEWARVLPVLREALTLGVPVSLDTYKPAVMQAALDMGVDIINDIWALRQAGKAGQPGAQAVVASHPRCGVCLMHMHGEPQTMQQLLRVELDDIEHEVLSFLEMHTQHLQGLGVDKTRIVWDLGIGFGKTVAQNFQLLAQQATLLAKGYPLLAGWSRKSSLGAVTALPVEQRLIPSVTAAVLAVERGARIVRVHDVKETVAALQVWQAMMGKIPVSQN
jgi:dihydropteroate synthase